MRNIFCHFGLTASKRYTGIYICKYVSVYEPLELYRKRSIPCALFIVTMTIVRVYHLSVELL